VIRNLVNLVLGLASIVVVSITSPLLLILGRSQPPTELVVDPDLLADDPGVDVDLR
jgi:hypothetical protein